MQILIGPMKNINDGLMNCLNIDILQAGKCIEQNMYCIIILYVQFNLLFSYNNDTSETSNTNGINNTKNNNKNNNNEN